MGINDANHGEYPGNGTEVISPLACSLMMSEIEVAIMPGTRLAGLHDAPVVLEQTNCNYGLNPEHQHIASEGGLIVSAVDETGEVRAIERPDHPFFVATLYQPQRSSKPSRPHPLVDAFVLAAAG